ncbi:hypothetical protein P389DRAFT_172987 [Cystobasidium minutum MCA 4210]|uniref:uncharacterized protein n=1 Tax=Cystobasidium minutum MCA 4210 TaxID=1397322 RepID=UPI0034CDF897|eukprot:jgi/Rhomi1/172987/fgenesh1_kg.5_\
MICSKVSLFLAGALLLISAPAQADKILFDMCPEDTSGIVSSVDITPCERKHANEPCKFRFGEEYTITIGYTSLESSGPSPRSSLVARDDTQDPVFEYAYSGQAFDACEYTACPVEAGLPSTYTYHFQTLKSRFNYLTFNATTSLAGPSFLCVGFEALYVPSIAGRKVK